MIGSKKLPVYVPLNGLIEIAFDAFLGEFRSAMRRSEFSDIRPAHGCVFRYMPDGGMRPSGAT